MEVSRAENLPPPPGIINSIKAGFDVIAMHITAIFFPLLLDVFIWLGPRLRLTDLYASLEPLMVEFWRSSGVPTAEIDRAVEWYNTGAAQINLLWLLRTMPVGISSLPFINNGNTPLGTPATVQVGALGLFGWLILLTVIGWVGGGLYFRAVANFAIQTENQPGVGAARAVTQTILLSVIWGILAMLVFVPLMAVLALVAQLSQALASLLILFASFIGLWLLVPLYFWSHGIFVRRENVLTAMLSSWRLTRFMLPASNLFVLTVFLLAFGLNFLWRIPPEDSWMALVGIFGHAFVTTALLAASFIYYRDASIWLEAALEKFRASKVKA